MRIREIRVLSASKVGLCGTGAVVHGDDECGVGYKTVRPVGIHLDPGRVTAKVGGDLNQLVLGSQCTDDADSKCDEGG